MTNSWTEVEVRLATWNLKQAVAPRQPLEARWQWIDQVTSADVLILTEAKVPDAGPPEGWRAVHTEGGIGKRRRWGTVTAVKGLEVRRAEFKRRRTKHEEDRPNPATTFTIEILRGGEVHLRVVGAYGLLEGTGNGFRELEFILNECEDVIRHFGSERLVVAGDFNLWPDDVIPAFDDIGLVDVVSRKAEFPQLDDPIAGSRIWTHKNGSKDSNGARQEIDFIFASADLLKVVEKVEGGVDDFPESWDWSDHAPVAATFRGL